MRAPKNPHSVIPAQAGIQWFYSICFGGLVHTLRGNYFNDWIPAFAGMTNEAD
jgi:hypothetical protein